MDYFVEKRCSAEEDKEAFMKHFISDVREEFEDHLQAINENTNEIEANHEFLCGINSKIDKIAERLERIELFLSQNSDFSVPQKQNYVVKPLSNREKEVFLMLYTLEDSMGYATYLDISRRTGLTEDLVSGYVTSMIEKGVPVQKKYVDGKAHLRLDSHFRTIQTKKNILKIEQRLISDSF